MRKTLLLSCAAAGVLFLNVNTSSAQSATFELSPAEETTLFTVREAPAAFDVEVGADVPAAVELYDAPAEFAATSPAKRYVYTRRGNKVYVVDRATRKVVRVITRRS